MSFETLVYKEKKISPALAAKTTIPSLLSLESLSYSPDVRTLTLEGGS